MTAGLPVRLVGLLGSLQQASSNRAVFAAAAAAAPAAGAVVVPGPDLGGVPHLNPDLDGDDPPAAVVALRTAVGECDAVLIVTPEYGHGMPGFLKNALDWLVSSGELAGKPVGVVAASPTPTGGIRAATMLTQTLLAQAAEVAAVLTIPAVNSRIADGVLADEVYLRRVGEAVAALADTVRERASSRR